MYRKLLIAVLVGLQATGCATPKYMSPAVSASEMVVSYTQGAPVTLKPVKRTVQEHREMATQVEYRLRQALDERFCNLVADDHVCSFKVVVEEDNEKVNAYANQTDTVVIFTGLMQYMDTDDELAYVMAHEISHTLAKHIQETRRNAVVGSVLGALLLGAIAGAAGSPGSYTYQQTMQDAVQIGGQIGGVVGARTFSKDQENEADYIAVYLTARSGYDPNAGRTFFDKLSQIHPTSEQEKGLFASHPANPERRARIIKTIAEIDTKKSAGQPLYPQET